MQLIGRASLLTQPMEGQGVGRPMGIPPFCCKAGLVPESVLGQAEKCICGGKTGAYGPGRILIACPVCDEPDIEAQGHLPREASQNLRAVRGLSLFEKWEAYFKPLLGHTLRWEGFRHIVKDQLERERPVIIETGTLREPGNWDGDGCSTALWNWLAGYAEAYVVSVDLVIETAQHFCWNVKAVRGDSVSFLRNWMTLDLSLPAPISLLYLDSYDYTHGNEVNAAMHQVAELAAIWERLPAGCLIASDDNAGPGKGKAALLRGLLEMLHIQLEVDSHIVVWRKP